MKVVYLVDLGDHLVLDLGDRLVLDLEDPALDSDLAVRFLVSHFLVFHF